MYKKKIKHLVSVITPSYNSAMFIKQTIESVIKQTHQKWEMIIIDDCSTDASVNIIRDYIQKDSRIRLITLEENSGPAIARNKGIKVAKGKYLTFIDSDDIWNEYFLEKSIKFINIKECDFIFASYERVDENLKSILKPFIVPKKVNYHDVLKTCSISCLTAFMDMHNIGKFYMENVGHEDYTLWLKILKKIDCAYGIQEPLAKYRISNNSLSRNKIQSALWQWQIYRKIEKLSLIKSIYYFVQYAYYGFKKYNS
ncbi:Putative N-acetylgalactosaminyl-diphosphoundecaprenol glucuronosyltransferase [hydrothermal vent metagenome]|uniref:Putative N-acetylgalactosaminyl-diphosphoundecaprenol glucuronosyltransferase n=1 Tax=hydrothermal vent metagenome TaxID=652676 RepID=A0A1W1E4R1_9ZZZZ